MNSFWIQSPEKYTSISNESKEVILHPFLASLINDKNYQKILDYGCGDGSLMKRLNGKKQISIYDNSLKALIIAEKNLMDIKPRIFTKAKDLPIDHFDCVVLSLVLMTISNEREIKKVLKNIYHTLVVDGTILIAVTHPCFRAHPFSSFHTTYNHDNFHYMNDGEPFSVTLEDQLLGKDITFTDYHWSLAHNINSIVETGFRIHSFHEIRDKSFNDRFENPNYCPYLVINALKQG